MCIRDSIRIHDLRHSHVSLLIAMGFSALAIADRVGHESGDITYKLSLIHISRGIGMEIWAMTAITAANRPA